MNTDKGSDKASWIKNHQDIVDPAYPESELTGKILEAAFAVHNVLGLDLWSEFTRTLLLWSCDEVGLIALMRVR
jgi:hypothetical protein